MSENKDRKHPISKVAKNSLIKQKFPVDKPIMWGPNQETIFPDQYNEPSGWNKNEYLRIPKVVRFFTGGQPSIPRTAEPLRIGIRSFYKINPFYKQKFTQKPFWIEYNANFDDGFTLWANGQWRFVEYRWGIGSDFGSDLPLPPTLAKTHSSGSISPTGELVGFPHTVIGSFTPPGGNVEINVNRIDWTSDFIEGITSTYNPLQWTTDIAGIVTDVIEVSGDGTWPEFTKEDWLNGAFFQIQ